MDSISRFFLSREVRPRLFAFLFPNHLAYLFWTFHPNDLGPLSTIFCLIQNRIYNAVFSSGKRHLHRATKSFSARKIPPLFCKILRRWYPLAQSMRTITFYGRSMGDLCGTPFFLPATRPSANHIAETHIGPPGKFAARTGREQRGGGG